ncbi:MAG: glycosyltransferase family 9 protein [Desulfovibrio sp.]|jgi:ADP-heptose:LPS heptosyltransferase|nr:glycosyltransferase family 9 protein [Desulfovibrio sp.]
MSADPILVLQLQRMGDLILTFPLLLTLKHLWPEHPIRVVAEPLFFKELMPLSPEVVFFPPSHCAELSRGQYATAINLSGRPEAAACLARLTSGHKLGPAAHSGKTHIYGYWQLYRAALTQNNRHNAFHWSDLHMLDLQKKPVPQTRHMSAPPPCAGRVGLVLGASEAAKRPDASFWARLAARLTKSGATPVFLGGRAEEALGQKVASLAKLPKANLCGRLSITELADVMRSLSLCITPDTGPMHLADWLNVPVLNLSMGPVHARETGPMSRGRWILRANQSCAGCWQCRSQPYCKQAFSPHVVCDIALSLLDNTLDFPTVHHPGLRLFRTGRDSLGLHCLETAPGSAPSCRFLLEDFWQAAFLYLHTPDEQNFRHLAQSRLANLHTVFPPLGDRLRKGFARLAAGCAQSIKSRDKMLPANFWRSQPPLIRLFSGHLHMFLQNEDYSPQGWQTAVDRLTLLSGLFV